MKRKAMMEDKKENGERGGLSRRGFFRKLACAGLSALILIGVCYRIPQVMIFAASAALSSPWRTDFSISRKAVESWSSDAPLVPEHTPQLTRTAVTFHPEYQDFDASYARRGLQEAAELGVEFVRTDVRWSAVLPDGMTPDENAFDWYRLFFKTAQAYGLKPLIVLSSPPASVKRLPKRELLDRWQLYVDQVVSHLGDLSVMYQVLNEPNNPIYSIFDSVTTPEAVMTASQLIKSRVPGAKVLVNFLVDIPHWRHYAELLLSHTNKAIDLVGVDHYPGTWTLGPNKGWSSCIRELLGIDTTIPGSVWYGRELAIVETGFSTNMPGLRGPHQQNDFYLDLNQNLRNLGPLRNRLSLVGFYELCDSNSSEFLNPEAHFGLLKDDCSTRKPVFAIAQQISLEAVDK